MMIGLFLLVMLVIILIGGLWVRRYRKEAQQELERKLKIAEGKFDELAEPAVVPGRMRQLAERGFQRAIRIGAKLVPDRWKGDFLPDVSDEEIQLMDQRVRDKVPPLIEAVLRDYAEYGQAVREGDDAEEAFAAALEQLNSIQLKLSDRLRRGSADAWIESYRQAHELVRATGRAYAMREDRLDEVRQRWDISRPALQETLAACAPKEALSSASLSPESQAILSMGRLAYEETKSVDDPPRDTAVPRDMAESSSMSNEVRPLLEEMLEATKATMTAGRNLTQQLTLVGKDFEAIEALHSSPIRDPAKPTEQDVQPFISASLDWAADIFEKRCAALAKLAPLMGAVVARHAPHDRWDAGLKRFEELLAGHSRSDEDESLVAVGKLVHKAVFDLTVSVSDRAMTWRLTHDCAAPDRATTEAERNSCAALHNAVRKLGFALGQAHAASAKLAAGKTQKLPLREAHEPTLDETNVDRYVRVHRAWCDVARHNRETSDSHNGRLDTLSQHESDRLVQVREAAQAVQELLDSRAFQGKRSDMARELQVSMMAAERLCRRYQPQPEQAQPTIQTVTAATTTATTISGTFVNIIVNPT